MIVAKNHELKIIVGACTCRNSNGLRKLLESLVIHQTMHDVQFIIVDNDVKEEGRPVCAEFIARGMSLSYSTETRTGIPFARNALIAAAMVHYPDYVLMIDDDEYPLPGWIDNLVGGAVAAGADVAGGPVTPVFEVQPQLPLQVSDYTKDRAATVKGRSAIDSTANLLLSGQLLRTWKNVFFDDRFAQTGGSDSEFLRRTQVAGYGHVFVPSASVLEDIPAGRLCEDWLMRRHYRNGSVKARIEIYGDGQARAALAIIPVAFALFIRAYLRDLWSSSANLRAGYLSRKDRARARGMLDAFCDRIFQEYSAENYR